MADIRFSAEAVRDLGEIRKNITEELSFEESAASVTARTLERIAKLKNFPHMGAPLQTVVADFSTPTIYKEPKKQDKIER